MVIFEGFRQCLLISYNDKQCARPTCDLRHTHDYSCSEFDMVLWIEDESTSSGSLPKEGLMNLDEGLVWQQITTFGRAFAVEIVPKQQKYHAAQH